MSISYTHATMRETLAAQGPKFDSVRNVRYRQNRGVVKEHKARKRAEAIERDKLTPWHRTKRYRRLHGQAP